MKLSIIIHHTLLVATFLLFSNHAGAKSKQDTLVMKRVFSYYSMIDTTGYDYQPTYTYTKYHLDVKRRNVILLAVPTMYAVAHGGNRSYVGETYSKVELQGNHKINATRLLELTTVPHKRKTLPTLIKYLTPAIYNKTMIDNFILSPFNKANRIFYHYRTMPIASDVTILLFQPKLNNTQLVNGSAYVETTTGRIIWTEINGEFDMINFHLIIHMGQRDFLSTLPSDCQLDAHFNFLGNKITTKYYAQYGMDKAIGDSIGNLENAALMDSIRPIPLTEEEKKLYTQKYEQKNAQDSLVAKNSKRLNTKKILWDAIGEHLVNRFRSSFGTNHQGSFRISPILNPLYFGYSRRKGLFYKFDVRGDYNFSTNSDIWLRFKAGYSFKKRQLYFSVPVNYYYNKRKNAYVGIEFGNGNHITNSDIADKIKQEKVDSIDWNKMNLDYFKDSYLKIANNYDFSNKFGVQAGLYFHRRSAIDKQGFHLAGKPTVYKSSAPFIQLQYRPTGWDGPIATLDYERSYKGLFNSNTAYERWEFDGQYLHKMQRLQSLSLRAGVGFYTHKDNDAYFLDYTNFRDNNIPNGWNDDWTGEFELLDRNWYNASQYYVRSNVTYESPILFTSWIPLVGHFIEMERIYVSALSVNKLHPYMECGYGFTTRLFSIGLFMASKNGQFNGFGCKIEFELFRQW